MNRKKSYNQDKKCRVKTKRQRKANSKRNEKPPSKGREKKEEKSLQKCKEKGGRENFRNGREKRQIKCQNKKTKQKDKTKSQNKKSSENIEKVGSPRNSSHQPTKNISSNEL
jgi:hypothetical protein